MARSTVSRNKKVIENAKNRVLRNRDKMCEQGLRVLLPEAVKAALEHHPDDANLHRKVNEFYAWAIVHNGSEVARWQNKHDRHGRIEEAIESVKKNGWYGVVIAGMRSYYSVDIEIGVFYETMSDLYANFNKYFKQIQ